ncbi:GH39 family glycosyl hydrolase [Pseudonocardia nigra]|uniref:GH39 family glycosyl hydrolase n=1 Tax=Pseudonocardia nigra TaxID=1921578 RepID=UPI001C5EEEA7|nr:hypothetical protein [Pseudonocardia nigra]
MRPPRLLAAVLVALAVALGACSTTAPSTAVPDPDAQLPVIELAGEWNWQRQAGPLELGVTHTEDSLDSEEPAEARQRGIDILSEGSAIWQNHHLMGFGTLNPEPSPDEYSWATLDKRMQLTQDTGGGTVLTLCCAPDWMKGGEAGQTDWSELETAPDPEYFDEFAELSALAVQRYPQVERVLVWNELKGFYNHDENRWDYEGYTELYNQVYTAVKEVRPDVQVGGPYVVLTSLDPGSEDSSDVSGPWGVADQRALDVVEYWLANNVGADFLVVDGSAQTRQGTMPEQVSDGAQKFADLTRWIGERTSLPVWWAEYYPDAPEGEVASATSPASAVSTLAAVAAFAESDVAVALHWGPQGHGLEHAALWTDSTRPDGGQPTPLTEAWQWLVPRLAAGEVEIGRSATAPLLAFRALDGVVVVNLTGEPVEVEPGSEPVDAWAINVTHREF